MPKTYARIDAGRVIEMILPAVYDSDSEEGQEPVYKAGDDIPIERRFTPEFVDALIDITDLSPAPAEGWAYDGSTFAPYVAPPPSAAQIIASNTSTQSILINVATQKIAILTDATDPDIVDTVDPADVAALKKWKQYRVALSKIDLTQEAPQWPATP